MKRKLTRTHLRALLLREIRLLKEEETLQQPLEENVMDALSAAATLTEFEISSPIIKGDDTVIEGRSKADGEIKFVVTFPS